MLKRYLQSPKLRKSFFIFLGAFFLFLIAGDVYFSKSNVIEGYVRARQKADLDMEDLKPYLVWGIPRSMSPLRRQNMLVLSP